MLRRIGVFDSGIGGLTVLRELRRTFPGLDMIYLGDLARVPYGGRAVETITRYACDDVRFLLGHDIDAVVVACGTVSSNSMEALRSRFDLPIYGVIESAVERAAAVTKTGVVGVVGTRATVSSGAYERQMGQIAPAVRVLSQACPLVVPLVEDGVSPEDPAAELICRRYLAPLEGQGVDALILGCTHYPVYRSVFQRLLPQAEMIDIGQALAARLKASLGETPATGGRVEYYATERSAAFSDVVRIMDPDVDPESIHVVKDFIQ